MTMSSIAAILAVALALAAIGYVWSRVMAEGGLSDGTPGSVLDANESVRRIDMSTHTYAAQQAQQELSEHGLTTRLVTLEQGAFGIGLGEHYYIVYNAEDEPHVREIVDRYINDLD